MKVEFTGHKNSYIIFIEICQQMLYNINVMRLLLHLFVIISIIRRMSAWKRFLPQKQLKKQKNWL